MRKAKECPVCGESVSLSNFARHVGSKSCLNGGKNRTREEKHPWELWEIRPGVFRLPCGYEGNKVSCRNKLTALAAKARLIDGDLQVFGFSKHNELVRSGKKKVHNRGRPTSPEQKEKLSLAAKKYHEENVISDETRKALSVARKKYLKENPCAHVNARVAGNRGKMTYPEQVAHDWFQKMGINALHNHRVGKYFPDFLVGSVIVEIDGEQWHSSPSQVAYDKNRDRELSRMGYVIHRIPAKSRIEEALAALFLGDSTAKA